MLQRLEELTMSESEKVDAHASDAELYEGTVVRAEPAVQRATGIVGWNFRTEHGETWLESTLCAQQPEAGERVRFWGREGRIIRGIEIGGRLYRYRTREENRVYLSQWGWSE